ncbi:hypothetical protein LOD99_155 [Oopsacas minuta]|uniref:MHD2 domain-containing protein n=1 Tax=Oopsacas minuta TaxID=111878 RepID=A0AAV7K847_9METZ|nr:hypothetical protein LOD99_155 [Oopsacas minuta]
MATNVVDEISIVQRETEEPTRTENPLTVVRKTTDSSNLSETGINIFPSIHNNFSKLRSNTEKTSNISYTSCTSLLTHYIKVEGKLKWKFLPEQQAGCLLVITKQVLEEILGEELETWNKFQSARSQNPIPPNAHVLPDLTSNKAGSCLSHSKNLILLHRYFLRFTKNNACVKLCIASPPPKVTKGFTYPSSLLRPIQQLEEPMSSRFAHMDGLKVRWDLGRNRQLGDLCEDEKRSLELAYLCAEFPVLSAPPPPELEQEEDDNNNPHQHQETLQFLSVVDLPNQNHDSVIFQSIDTSSLCSHPNTISPLSIQTEDSRVKEKPFPPLNEVSSESTVSQHNGRFTNSHITESQHIETVEMLLTHLRQAFGLVIGDFNLIGKSVRSKAGLFVKSYTGKSETLYRELLHRFQVLEKSQHPYYRQNAFPSKAAYEYWLREEKNEINILIHRFYHRIEADTRSKPVIRVPLPRDLHKCYSILLSILLQYELSNCLTGYLTPRRENANTDITDSFDSIQQLRRYYNQTDKQTFHPSTTRLLEEYALRYGVGETYRHLAFLDCLSREFCIQTIQDCRIIESIIAKLISKLYQLGDIISAHPRPARPQCPTTTLLKQERNIFLQTLHQLSKKIQGLITIGIEKIASANCVHNNHKAIKRILNGAIVLLELVMDTHGTLQNLTNIQTKSKNNMLSVEAMLTRWFKSFVAETYGHQKLRIAKDHNTENPENSEDCSANTLNPVMVNKLLSVVSLEIRRMREYYQEPLRNYFNVSQLVTSEYYKFICQDIEYLCRRHCRNFSIEPGKLRMTEERDLNMMGLMFNLDHNDTVLWTSYLPEQSIAWRNEFLRLFIEKWNVGIQNEMTLFIKSIIKSDKWETRIADPITNEYKATPISSLKQEFAKSPNSAFSSLFPQPNPRLLSEDSDNGPMIPQSVHGNQTIGFSPNPSTTEDEASMRDRYMSPSSSDFNNILDYDINEGNCSQSQHTTTSENSDTKQSKHNSSNLTLFSKRESSTDQEEGGYTPVNNNNNNTTIPRPIPNSNQLGNVRRKLPVSNSLIDVLIMLSRYTSLIINILQTLSPLKFIRNRSHIVHAGLPLEVLKVKKFVDYTRTINAQMKQTLYTEASNTLSKICLTFAYNFICMDYCGLSRDETLEIMNGDKDNLLEQLEQLTRDKLTYGCRHTIQSGDYSHLCATGKRHTGDQTIEKLSKEMALRINNLYVITTMWEELNSRLLEKMSTQNIVPQSAYFWSTSTTDMQTPLTGNRSLGEGEDQIYSFSNESENEIDANTAAQTQIKLEKALKLEVNVLAYKINSGFLQFFSVLIELNLPEFNEKQRLAPALNYLGDCLNFLGRYLYPDVFRYSLQRIWYNIIRGLENKAKIILKRINSTQRARAITELYLHVLSCLINFFKCSPDQGGLDSHLLMDTSEFFSYLLHFHLLESVALLKLFKVLKGECSGGYQIEFSNTSLDNENPSLDMENTLTAHTGLSRPEIISFLDVKLSCVRKSFTGKELITALMALRADTIPREWKGAQYGWEPIAKEISKDLIKQGDITQLSLSQERVGDGNIDGFSLNKYYRIVHSRRIVRSICYNPEENTQNFKASNLSLYQDSEADFDEAKMNTLQYIYDILRLREKEHRVTEFLRSLNHELVSVLNRDRSVGFDKLLVVHD